MGGQMRPSRVFVSHTSDLGSFPAGCTYVQAVLDAVARAGMAAVDMRYFAAREGQPADYCQRRVRECDVYVAVVGFRYGSLVPGEMVSYTELEFVEAGMAGLPRLVFLLDDSADAHAADVDRAAVEAFRTRLKDAGLICASFATVESLELAVFQALTEWAGADARAVVRQLPAAAAHFAGRTAELATLTGLLRGGAEAGATVVISAIDGTAGVGKTALAVYWAHQVADRFPDGQLHVNLRGFDPGGQVMDPAQAVRRFLDALGVPAERVPVDLDAQAALYRSELAGRRMLVVLDNARDSAQVRPLLPGAPTCLVLVTSRTQLTSLVAEGAHPVNLDLFTPDEARQLLTNRIGSDRLAADPQAAEEIIARCARLPLALGIVTARAAARPGFPLRALAGELADSRDRLDMLTADDPGTDVRAVFSWSYNTLSQAAACMFRLLGLHPGPDLSAPAAASLAALTVPEVRPLLAELVRANLLVEHIPGRYTCHDLLWVYATDLTQCIDPDQERRAATHRMLDHYLYTAYAAEQLLHPAFDPLILTAPQPGVTPEHAGDRRQALVWFTAEHAVLLATVDRAAAAGWDTHVWQLAWVLSSFLHWQGHWHDWAAAGHAALDAAHRLEDPIVVARAHRILGYTGTPLVRYDEAIANFRCALDLYRQAGDRIGQAETYYSLGYDLGRRGEFVEALDHYRQGLDLYRAAGHRRGWANSRNAVGWYLAHLGHYRQALADCRQALSVLQELGDLLGQANTCDSLGYIHRHLGNYAEAVTHYQQSVDLYRELGDRYDEAATLTDLGDTHHAAGNPDTARDAWQQALSILDDFNHPDAEQVRTKLAALDASTQTDQPPGR
jgi:tetratricopeptide (TPR) repeat protein